MSDFFIYDAALRRVGELSDWSSVQWGLYYQAPGEVKVVCEPTARNMALLRDGHFLHNPGADGLVQICELDFSSSRVGGRQTGRNLVVRGKGTAEALRFRTKAGTDVVENAEAGIYRMVQKNLGGLPFLLAPARGYAEAVGRDYSWGSVLEQVAAVAEVAHLGFKTVFDPEKRTETFTVYRGVDRTGRHGAHYVGYLGTDAGNLRHPRVVSGSPDYCNVANVLGSDGTLVTVALAGGLAGRARREVYVPALDIGLEYREATVSGADAAGNPTYTYTNKTRTPEEYRAALAAKGRQALAKHAKGFAVSCDVLQFNLLYGRDYGLGDRLPVKIPEFGVYATARVEGVLLRYEGAVADIGVTLGDFSFDI